MKTKSIILILIICFSCKKEETTLENVFLENLKEYSKNYIGEIDKISEAIQIKYEETNMPFYKEDLIKLKNCRRKIDIEISSLNFIEKTEIIKNQIVFAKSLNQFGLKCRFENINIDKMKSLPKEILIEYLKEYYYRILCCNYKYSLRSSVVFCGFHVLSKDEIQERIPKLEKEIDTLKQVLKNYRSK